MSRTKFIALFLLALGVTLPAAAFGQSKKAGDAPSLLYQVTGNGLSRPSYIFGTFHAICAAEMVPFENLDTYLTETDQLLMEIDMDDTAEMQSMTKGIMIPGGKTLKDVLTAEKFAKVDEMMKNYLGYSVEIVKMVKPFMLTVMVLTSPKAIGCTPTVYDLKLMQSAVTKKKPVVGLETVASQFAVIDSKTLEEQADDLYEMAEDPQKSIGELKKLMGAYKTRDVENLFQMASKGESKDEKFMTRLLDDRNRAWIPKLETAFQTKPTFVAVGAGHLGGKNGVIRLLRKKGYKVTPVMLGPIAAGDN